MQIDSLNLKLHGALLGVMSLLVIAGGIGANRSFENLAAKRDQDSAHRNSIEEIENQSEIAQSYIDNHVPVYNTVILNSPPYVCDPNQPPTVEIFNYQYFVDQVKAGHNTPKLWVVDASIPAKTIGYIDATGWYFQPGNCS